MKELKEAAGVGTIKCLDYLVNPSHGCSSAELSISIISLPGNRNLSESIKEQEWMS